MDKDKCCSCCSGCGCCTFWALVVSGAIFSAWGLFHLYRVLIAMPLVINGDAIPLSYSWIILVVAFLLALWNFCSAHKVSKCQCHKDSCNKDL